jgi:hypothetical protein
VGGVARFLGSCLAVAILLFAVVSSGVQARAANPPLGTPLVFGIYPGGGAGTVGPGRPTAPENTSKRLAALQHLRAPGRPFVVHIYATYSGPGSISPAEQVGQDIAQYTAAGFRVELVLTYRPSDKNPARDVSGFVEFVRSAVREFGSSPRFVSLQVTNEANVRNAPNAADGYYVGAEDALLQGVIAAKMEARKDRFAQVAVGFNWAYSLDRGETVFWRRLGQRGGAAFRGSLDWVGLDVYPETWGPRVARGNLAAASRKTMLDSLATLRNRFMPLAGLSRGVPLHICENGYPTGPKRTEAMQVSVMRAAIAAVDANRAAYHITDYRWFDLRDARSSSNNIESQYGLMNDDYTPKTAFGIYRNLVATLGRPHAGTGPSTAPSLSG